MELCEQIDAVGELIGRIVAQQSQALKAAREESAAPEPLATLRASTHDAAGQAVLPADTRAAEHTEALTQVAVLRERIEQLEAENAARQARIEELQAEVQAELQAKHQTASPQQAEPARLNIARPTENQIAVSIGERTVTLTPVDISALIEELAYARASMRPEPPNGLPAGWRFVATHDPVMASQSRKGAKLVVLRHTGYGWVPFTFSPNMLAELLAVLSAT